MIPNFPKARSLRVTSRDFASFEGISLLGRQMAALDGRLLEVWVQARPTTAATIADANRALARISVCS
jgi:hypothetical protein